MTSQSWLSLALVSALFASSCSSKDGEPGEKGLEGRSDPERVEFALDPLDLSSAPGSLGPWLVSGRSPGVRVSWLEPMPVKINASEPTFALRWSRLRDDGSGWEPPITIDEGTDFWPNWADVSAVTGLGDGWVAHRLRTLAEGTYDYGIQLLHSEDGTTWARGEFLHADRVPAEHGFVSYAPLGTDEGSVQAFWLDGREMPGGGPMTLRTARLVADRVVDRTLIDDRVCECCPTSAASTSGGVVVVYRNRSSEEYRDIWIARLEDGVWSEPRPVHEDHWEIAGCPVNGPVVTSDGVRTLWVTWYTVADGVPTIRAALSRDGGVTFDGPIDLDQGKVLGRVAAVADGGGAGAWVSWLTRSSEEGGRLQFAHLSPENGISGRFDLMPISPSRRSGYPQMVSTGENELILAWTEVGEQTRVRTARVRIP